MISLLWDRKNKSKTESAYYFEFDYKIQIIFEILLQFSCEAPFLFKHRNLLRSFIKGFPHVFQKIFSDS